MSLYQASPAMLVEENNNTLAEASRERPAGRKGGLQHSMSQLSVTSAVDLGVHQLDSDNRPFQDRSQPSLYSAICFKMFPKGGKCCISGVATESGAIRSSWGKLGLIQFTS